MAASLIVRLHKPVQLSGMIDKASELLARLLDLHPDWKLSLDLPPTKKHLSLEGQALDWQFPGARVQIQGVEQSTVALRVFNSPVPDDAERLLLSCEASGRGPAAEVFAATLSAAAAMLTEGSIDDGGHHWLDKDEYGPEDLIAGLRLSERPEDFHAAVELVYRRLAIHERYPAR